MSIFQTGIREICLVGPSTEKDDGPSYLWVAHFTALYDKYANAKNGAMRNPSLRVLAERAEPRKSLSYEQPPSKKDVEFHDPTLLSVAVRPEVGWSSSLFFDAAPSGQRAKAISGLIGNRRERNAFSIITTVPALAQNQGKWPDKTNEEIQVPALRLTAGAIPILVTRETDKKHKEKVGYWTLLRATVQSDKFLSLFGKKMETGVFVSAEPKAFKVLTDSLNIADDGEEPNSKESGDPAPKALSDGKQPSFAVDLTPDGIEFDAVLRLSKITTADVRLRLEARSDQNDSPFVLVLLEDRDKVFRKGLDEVAANLRQNGYPVALDLRPGTPRIIWELNQNGGVLTLPDICNFVLEEESVRVSLLGDAPKGGAGRTVARLSKPQAKVTWADSAPSQIRISAGEKAGGPVAILGVNNGDAAPKRFGFQLGESVTGTQPSGNVTVIVDASAAGSTGSVYLALERGVVQLPRPSEKVFIQAADGTNAFEGLIHLRGGSHDTGVSTFTVDAATQAEVIIKYDKTQPADTKVETKLYGAVGALDGYVWAAAASPTAEEIVPTLDNGPISLRSLPLLFGGHEPIQGYEGTIAPVTEEGPVEVTIEAPKTKDDEAPNAVIWAPHPQTMHGAYPQLPPVVATVSMTRTVPNATEPSRTRDLVPVTYKPTPKSNFVKLTLSNPKGRLPICIVEGDVMQFGWPIDVPLAAVTLPGVEYTAEENATPKLRFDLPLLDDFHASATPRRKREEAKTDREEAAPSNAVTAETPPQLGAFWEDQERRRRLTRSAHDIFAEGTSVIGSVAMPFSMSDTVSFGVQNGGSLPLGYYTINGKASFGEDALAGLSTNYEVEQAASSKLKRNPEGPIKITGFATAPYEVTIGKTRAAQSTTGDAWQDTRGHAFTKTSTSTDYAHLRRTHFQSKTDEVETRTLVTSLQATKVQIADGVETFLAFRDLPTLKSGNGFEFSARNLTANPYSCNDLPSSMYEWRHYEATKQGKPSEHDIAFGPLRLKPLRLKNALFDADGICKQAEVEYRVDLPEISGDKDQKPDKDKCPDKYQKPDSKVPYGPDDIYRTGSVISVSYRLDNVSKVLKAERVQPSPANVLFRVNADLKADQLPNENNRVAVDISFDLEITGQCLGIKANSGKLGMKIFGFDRTFENASVTSDKGVLTIKATPSAAAINDGLEIKELKLSLSCDSNPTLDIDATLKAAPAGGDSALVVNIGKSVNFYGFKIPAEKKTVVDHDTGVVSINISDDSSGTEGCIEALARGFPALSQAEGSMVFVLDKPINKMTPTQSIGAARVDLHILHALAQEPDGAKSYLDIQDKVRFLLQIEGSKVTRRRLTVSLGIPEAKSIIDWPTAALNGADDYGKAVFANLMSARDLVWETPNKASSSLIQVGVASTTGTVSHSVLPILKTFDIPEDALSSDGSEWILSKPVRARVVTKHSLKTNGQSLSWSAIDDVTLIDVNRFVDLAKAPMGYAFSPRYKNPGNGGNTADSKEVPFAGTVKTAPFGRAIGNYLGNTPKTFKQGIVLIGGAVHEAGLRDDLALTFGLPWIRFLEGANPGSAPEWPLPNIAQAPKSGAGQFTVSLFDLAAAVPHQRSKSAPVHIAVRGHRIADLMAEMKRLKVDPAIRVADLAFASNLPAYPTEDHLKHDPVIPDFKSPIFWRTLMALKRLFEGKEQPVSPSSFLTVFGAPDEERAVRIDLVASKAVNEPPQASKARIFVLDRSRVELSDLPGTLSFDSVTSVDAQRRVLLDARTAISDPLAVKVALVSADDQESVRDVGQKVEPAMEHHEGGVAIDPIRRQAVAKGRALRPEKDKTIHPEPSLGWPELGQLSKATESSLNIGEETPIQDSSVAWAGRARRFGGRLIASAGEELSASPKENSPVSFQNTSFLAIGRRVIFARDLLDDTPMVTSPVDRALMPIPPRARAPLPKEIEKALPKNDEQAGAEKVTRFVGNFLPGQYELVSTGVRPGAMVFEHTGILHTSNTSEFDPDHHRFGRPAERAPVVWTQGRAPRSTGLPKGCDLDLLRRTFISETIFTEFKNKKGEVVRQLKELELLDGPAGVIRYKADGSYTDKTVAIFVTVKSQLTEFDPGFEGGKIKLVFKRPWPNPDQNVVDISLCNVLKNLGVLSEVKGVAAQIYSLTIGNTMAKAGAIMFDSKNESLEELEATISFDNGFGAIRQALGSANPDTKALLQIRIGTTNGDPQPQLLDGPPKTLSIRLPVLPAVEPYLPISTATLAFGDPAYDRELAGPAKTAIRRNPTDAGSVAMLSLDRPAYDVGETIHFAAGNLDPTFFDPQNLQKAIPAAPWKSGGDWNLRIKWIPKAAENGISEVVPLTIADTKVAGKNEKDPAYKFDGGKAYGVSIAALRRINGSKPALKDGDRLSFIVNDEPESLTVTVTIVDEPVIAPSPAVYSLVTLDQVNGKEIATPILYASAPLPTILEFPDLLNDLARGHVRRRGLFVWQFVPRTANPSAALVKIDRTGGGQIPSERSDFISW